MLIEILVLKYESNCLYFVIAQDGFQNIQWKLLFLLAMLYDFGLGLTGSGRGFVR